MTNVEFEQILYDPVARIAHYRAMVQAYYERVTDSYRQGWGDSFHFALFSGSETLQEALVATERMIADEGGFRPGMQVLDIGCGVGGPALNIAAYSGAHVTGVNIVAQQLEIASRLAAERQLSERTRFVLADGMRLPFADGTFDRVYIFEAGCHMPDKAQFYKQCARVLRPGGLFLGLEDLRQDGLTSQEEAQYIEPLCRSLAIPHLATLTEFRRYLTDAGLAVGVLEDISVRGDVLRNWEVLDEKIVTDLHGIIPGLILKTVKGIRHIAPGLIPPVLRLLIDGGMAYAEAARAGAFILGYWRARKPMTVES